MLHYDPYLTSIKQFIKWNMMCHCSSSHCMTDMSLSVSVISTGELSFLISCISCSTTFIHRQKNSCQFQFSVWIFCPFPWNYRSLKFLSKCISWSNLFYLLFDCLLIFVCIISKHSLASGLNVICPHVFIESTCRLFSSSSFIPQLEAVYYANWWFYSECEGEL